MTTSISVSDQIELRIRPICQGEKDKPNKDEIREFNLFMVSPNSPAVTIPIYSADHPLFILNLPVVAHREFQLMIPWGDMAGRSSPNQEIRRRILKSCPNLA